MAVSLNRVQAEDYIRRVDEELRQQRRRLLALDTPLAILLPQHLRGLSNPLWLTTSPSGCCLCWLPAPAELPRCDGRSCGWRAA